MCHHHDIGRVYICGGMHIESSTKMINYYMQLCTAILTCYITMINYKSGISRDSNPSLNFRYYIPSMFKSTNKKYVPVNCNEYCHLDLYDKSKDHHHI